MNTTMIRPLGTVQDLAARLGIPRQQAYVLTRERRIPGLVRVGRLVRVDMDVLEEWISAGGEGAS